LTSRICREANGIQASAGRSATARAESKDVVSALEAGGGKYLTPGTAERATAERGRYCGFDDVLRSERQPRLSGMHDDVSNTGEAEEGPHVVRIPYHGAVIPSSELGKVCVSKAR
jgi:hypothetical protein